ncbi:MAG: ferrous iron transport protein B [Bacteroidales bacterium]|nr:ferrous iron transport protein B [Bacteroidales bacterium]
MSNKEEYKIASLADIPTASKCVIVKIDGHGGLRHRLMEMGFVRGETVQVIKNAPLSDPIEYQILQSRVSLRRSEARKIDVIELTDSNSDAVRSDTTKDEYFGTFVEEYDNNEQLSKKIQEASHTITVALVGNPNCGKTSFFNHATGLHEKVGNYGGVTVDIKTGVFYHKGYTIRLVDLPGTYSINEYSPEELCVREYLSKNEHDMILNIVDSSNLERNLFLTTQLIDMNTPMIMALNMFDEFSAKGDKFDYKTLSTMLGFPIVPTTASRGTGIPEVLQAIIDVFENKKDITHHIHINYGNDIENAIASIKKEIEENKDIINLYPSRYLAISALENVGHTIAELGQLPNGKAILDEAKHRRENLEKHHHEPIDTQVSNARYGFIRGALKQTYEPNKGNAKRWRAFRADDILTNRWLGLPVLLVFMWIMFENTFIAGAYPQEWLDMFISWLGGLVRGWMPEGMLSDLVVDGIIGGVGSVISFLPNILILFLFISIMEDTGYMARAAFMMDKLFHKFGLHGRSFIPYIMGFGCAVPAIMATRTLENRKDRLVTVLTIPFMSCSARLPVYLILIGTFFPKNQALVMMSLYLFGVLVAVLSAKVLSKTVFRSVSEEFVMELPPYRVPTARNVLMHMWDKSVQYLKKMGTIILAASIVIWALEYFPRNSAAEQLVAQQIEQTESIPVDSCFTAEMKTAAIDSLSYLQAAVHSEKSFVGRFGHLIEPVVRPCGFDWHIGVALCTGIAAKEIIVSTLGVLYQAGDVEDAEGESALQVKIKEQTWPEGSEYAGRPIYSPLVAYGLMIFVLLSVPCISTLAAIKREAGWGWVLFTFVYTIFLAWLFSMLIFQIGSLF